MRTRATEGTEEFPERELTEQIIKAALEVHTRLGPGFLESIYEEALAHEFRLRGIPFERQVPVPIFYKGKQVGEHRLDFLVGGKVVVELKCVESFSPAHIAQLISYLRATGLRVGLLINFQVEHLRDGIKRIVL